jgi:Cu2+-exporting ATPase
MEGLETVKNLDYIIFDKTGTLTKGEFEVKKIVASEASEREILELAASVEIHSQHAIAKAIVSEAKKRKIDIPQSTNFKSYPGKGAEGIVKGVKVLVGSGNFVKAKDSEEVGTKVFVVKEGKILGEIILEDAIREESKEAVRKVHELGIKTAMLTGDKKAVAEKVGQTLGIDTLFSEVLPQDKVKKVKELQAKGHRVGMVGDGVNDAPSLTQANVGIAIGAGTDVAIESAEIILVKNNPLDVVKAISLGRKVDAKMKQNLAWATGYNLLAIPAAAGVFSSWGIILRPEYGAILMSASSLIVVLNALSLKRLKL